MPGTRFQTMGRLVTLMSDTHIMVEVFKHRAILFALFLFNVSSLQMSKTITKLQKNDSKGYIHYSNKMGLYSSNTVDDQNVSSCRIV